MSKRLRISAVVLGLVMGGCTLTVNAQAPVNEIYARVHFPFMVGGKIFMPGDYQISRVDYAEPSIKVASWDGTVSVVVPVIARLARQDHSGHETMENLVFDRVGDQGFLSEVWILGEEGYLVGGTAEEHPHTVMPAKHKQ